MRRPYGALAFVFAVILMMNNTIALAVKNTYIIQGKRISHTSVDAGENGGCWGYANAIYAWVWGKAFSSQFEDPDNMLRDLSDEERRITAENTKAFISRAAIGAVIRVASAPSTDSQFVNDDAWYSTDTTPCYLDDGRTPKYAHSIILVDKSDTGFTYIQSSGGVSSERTRTWAEFAEAYEKYVYFKYIKWPGAITR